MAKVYYVFEMLQGSQNLCPTQMLFCSHYAQITAVEYISVAEAIVKVSWSNFQYNGAAAFKLSKRSPVPPGVSPKDRSAGQTYVLNVRQIKRIGWHPAKIDMDCIHQNISDTENLPDQNGVLDNPNQSEETWVADNESNVELGNGFKDTKTPVLHNVNTAPNFPRLTWTSRRSKKKADQVMIMVNTIETRPNKGNKTT